jgi:Na+-transporting methylmalonyl-CoA/oxaloacetate decarboxylase gamma subunit
MKRAKKEDKMGVIILFIIICVVGGMISAVSEPEKPKNPEVQKLKDGAKVGLAIAAITAYSIGKELNRD